MRPDYEAAGSRVHLELGGDVQGRAKVSARIRGVQPNALSPHVANHAAFDSKFLAPGTKYLTVRRRTKHAARSGKAISRA